MSRWDHTPAPRGDDYDDRWRRLEVEGHAIHGEADFVAAFGPRAVLDAGCGTGRVAIELARRGIHTVGVDRDPAMLATARRNGPDLTWHEHDLSTLDLGALDPTPATFDVVVAAGNVMIFLAPGTEAATVTRLVAHLEPEGRLVAGFSLGGDYGIEQYDADCVAAGLVPEARYATWQGDVWQDGGDYAVSVHRTP